jgi:hypothetical protein
VTRGYTRFSTARQRIACKWLLGELINELSLAHRAVLFGSIYSLRHQRFLLASQPILGVWRPPVSKGRSEELQFSVFDYACVKILLISYTHPQSYYPITTLIFFFNEAAVDSVEERFIALSIIVAQEFNHCQNSLISAHENGLSNHDEDSRLMKRKGISVDA